jgi:ABC-type branched-subunit amino acid transport system substrate-binding protein
MTRTRRSLASWLAVAMLLSGVVAGCGGKGDDEQAAGGGEAGALKTGPGVSDSTITLGLLTDLSGVFAALGKPVVQGTQLYWEDQNAAGGVCDRTVELTVKDHGYDPQKAVVLYRELSSEVAALQQMLGSPMTAALLPTLKRDSMLSMLAAWPSGLLGEEVIGILGATYDIETENGLQFVMKAGKLKEGDKIGHIYFEGDYGESGLEGSKRFAEANGMTVVEQKIKATDEDMSGQVSALKRQGVKAVALSTSPAQTASAVGVGAAQGLTVPYVGNGPTWDPALLKSPAAEAVKALLFVSASVAPFSKEGPAPEKAAAAFTKAHAKETPKASVQVGWAQGRLMYETLKKACENQDLSREGIVKAFHELSALDLEGLTAGPLDYTQLGESPSTATHVAQPAEVAGGLKVLEIVEGGDSA